MNLVRISQDVSIKNPEDISFYLVFEASGKEVRVQVSEKTANDTLEAVLGSSSTSRPEKVASSIPEGATVFGDEEVDEDEAPAPDMGTTDEDDSRFEEEQSI